jgi:hypothetical protein
MRYVHLLIVLSLLTLSACNNFGSDNNNPNNQQSGPVGLGRFINVASSVSALDFGVLPQGSTNSYTALTSNTTYNNQYGYFNLATGGRTFRVFLSGTNISAAAISNVAINQNTRTTILALDAGATIDTLLMSVADTTALPAQGSAFIRFIHASPDAPAVSIRDTTTITFATSLSRRQATAYSQRNAGTYLVRLFPVGSPNAALQFPVTLQAGGVYTVVISGSVANLNGTPLNAKSYLESSF